jgi:Rps23 Pro-64 3,4-dihydroxylase Tpa1-like proline 4-hydroxylase
MDSDIAQRTLVDLDRLERETDRLATTLASAAPFPHLVIDDLVSITPEEAESFPTADWDRWTTLGDEYQRNKRACNDIEAIPEPFRELIRQLSEPRFLEVLENITGIKRLLPDPYLTGGGLHLSGPHGILSEHTDFHYYRRLDLYRRINVLIYFNEDWSLEDGGCLSLFDEDHVPQVTVVPEFGRLAMFLTDDKSLHGFPVPVAEGKWRRSVALYYYTAGEAEAYSGDETTYFRAPVVGGPVRRARHGMYVGLLNLSRGIAVLAHLVNPAQGLSLFRTVLANRRREAERRSRRSGR